jgi:Tfp pilus assembly protein PilO
MEQKILISVSLSILLILGIIFLWWPKYQDFNNLRFEVRKKEVQLENKEQYFSELEGYSLKLKGYSSELSKINSALPENPGIPDLLLFLEKTGSQNGLALEKVHLDKISPLEQNSEIKKISLNLSFSGSYPAFKSFLSMVEKNARLIGVESISFSTPAKGEIFTFDLTIKTYSY